MFKTNKVNSRAAENYKNNNLYQNMFRQMQRIFN